VEDVQEIEAIAAEQQVASPAPQYPDIDDLRPDADQATITQENLPRAPVPPPSLFADHPLTALEAASGDAAPEQGVVQNVRSDDINDMFAENYAAARRKTPPLGTPLARRPYRKTPPLGTARPGQLTPVGGRAQTPSRIGRRVTPVMAQAVTPVSVPQIRRTPMSPALAIIEPAPANEPPPRQLAVAGAPSPTPIAVPALQDIAASRAIAHALETVAAQIRAGEIVVAGQVPVGEDVGSLAAAVAAALAALLGVQR
jgi:hypothetical protein